MQPGNSRHQTLSAEPLGSCLLRPGEPLCSSARPRLSVKLVCLKFSLCSVFSSVCLVLGFHCSSGCIVFPWVHLPQFIHRVFSFCCFVSSGSSLRNKGEIPPFCWPRAVLPQVAHLLWGRHTHLCWHWKQDSLGSHPRLRTPYRISTGHATAR